MDKVTRPSLRNPLVTAAPRPIERITGLRQQPSGVLKEGVGVCDRRVTRRMRLHVGGILSTKTNVTVS